MARGGVGQARPEPPRARQRGALFTRQIVLNVEHSTILYLHQPGAQHYSVFTRLIPVVPLPLIGHTLVQLPTIESLYGAVLANADYVIMGAGIPMEVPGILDSLAKNEDTKLVIDVDGSGDVVHHAYFSPKTFWYVRGAGVHACVVCARDYI